MADEFDLCECSWMSHEMAMRRLLSMLRQGQAYCTDTECIDELPGVDPAAQNDFVLMGVIFAAMMIMFIMRSYRNSTRGGAEAEKPKPFPGQGSDEPPNPPPAMN